METKENLLTAYAEVEEILSYMEQKYINKIPKKLVDLFSEEKDTKYERHITPNVPLTEQNLQRQTLVILAMLDINYWCENENEKQELIKLYAENDIKREEELREKYNPDNIFKKKEKIKLTENEENTAIVEYKKQNFFRKILNKITSLIK